MERFKCSVYLNLFWLRRGGQPTERVLLDQVYVSRGDRAASVNIVAEVGACDRLKGLRLTQIGVAGGNDSTSVNIANQGAHCPGNVADGAGRINDAIECDGQILRVGHTGQIDRALVRVRPGNKRASAGSAATCHRSR